MQNLGKPIAVGRTSEVFSWDNNKVLKLGYPSAPSVRNAFHATYLNTYFQIRPEQQQRLRIWQIVMAASHLGVSVPEERSDLLNIIYVGMQGCGN
jgi:hypothetical protein